MDSNADESPSFTSRHAAISVIPHITGALSVLGSLFIIVDILRKRQKKLGTTYHRILLGMSLSDVVGSFAVALSTWPIPSLESGTIDGGSIFGASGTQGTCSAQGFFVQVGMAAPLYNGVLSVYYLLMVRYRWNENSNKMRLLENICHVLVWLLALGTAFASLGLGLFNSANVWCWIAPLPLDCVSSVKAENGQGTCVRGDNAWVYRLAFYFIWIWLSFICVTFCMAMVYITVWKQTRRMDRYNVKGVNLSTERQSNVRRVAVQAALYVGAFYMTIIFPSIVRMAQARWNCTSEYFPLSILTVTFYPLQGFWNLIIYIRPRYLRYRKEHKGSSIMQVAGAALSRTFGRQSRQDHEEQSDTRNGTTANVSGETNTTTDKSSSSEGVVPIQDSTTGTGLHDVNHAQNEDLVDPEQA